MSWPRTQHSVPWLGLKPKALKSIICTNNPVVLSLILVQPWLPKPKEATEQKTFKGKNISFECVAKGFPLEVEWKVKRKNEDSLQPCISKFG